MPSIGTAAASQPGRSTVPGWSTWQRVLFRLAFAYLVLYLSYVLIHHAEFPVPVLGPAYVEMWNSGVSWIGVNLLHFGAQDMLGFGGDTLAEYVLVGCFAVLAVVGAFLWSLLDRHRTEYSTLHGWLRVLLRYSVAFILLDYGFGKVFWIQFKPPGFYTLLRPFGEFSLQQVLWEFMDVSPLYTFFAGAVEVLGALLLLFPRTTTLGAVVCAGAMLNVALLNLSYDVGVKLYSLHLLLMSAVLLVPDLKPLFQLLVLRRPTTPPLLATPRFGKQWVRIGAHAVWVVFVGAVLYSNVNKFWFYYRQAYVHPEHPPIEGLFEVESFSRNGRELPPLPAETTRWQRVAFDAPWSGKGLGYVHARTMDEPPNQWTNLRFRLESDPSRKSVVLVGGRDQAGKPARNPFTYAFPDPAHVVLDGSLGGEPVQMRLRRIDSSRYRLVKSRFRWVQPNSLGRPEWSLIR